ncbi:MAG: alanine dehydrogenase [Candidatus Dadabacteria bacterium]|nr:MAG: alanine dehydrogenase [Candidatus Dadabacteria bacterium]
MLNMKIGVPRERKTLEKRVALTPSGAEELIRHGHEVLIEKGAGEGSFFPDEEYRKAGCKIADTLADVWNDSELIVKVKEPHEEEYQYFRSDMAIFDYLHLAGLPDVAKAMLEKGITGIAYELVQTEDHRLPLLEPMSEIAGQLSVLNGANALLSQHGGRGMLMGGAIGVPACNVVVIGAGIAGRNAADVALGMGAHVTILDIDYRKLEAVKVAWNGRIQTRYSTGVTVVEECSRAQLVIGAVLVPGHSAPKVISRKAIESMEEGSVFVDISVDQGGCAETTRTTSLAEPTYKELGVIHYAVPNMPAQTPRTSTMALTAATLPYIIKLADSGVDTAIRKYPELNAAVNTYQGKLTNQAVSDSIGIDYTPLDTLLG